MPLRYGDYIAKLQFAACLGESQGSERSIASHRVPLLGVARRGGGVFKTETAVWDVGVQLCTDLEKMPVEDASVKWPEELSPYQVVGQLTVRPQEAYSPARRVYVDEILSFDPWHALAAHRPLGNVMRPAKRRIRCPRSFAAGSMVVRPWNRAGSRPSRLSGPKLCITNPSAAERMHAFKPGRITESVTFKRTRS